VDGSILTSVLNLRCMTDDFKRTEEAYVRIQGRAFENITKI